MEIPGIDETEGKFTKIATHKVAQQGYWSPNHLREQAPSLHRGLRPHRAHLLLLPPQQ